MFFECGQQTRDSLVTDTLLFKALWKAKGPGSTRSSPRLEEVCKSPIQTDDRPLRRGELDIITGFELSRIWRTAENFLLRPLALQTHKIATFNW